MKLQLIAGALAFMSLIAAVGVVFAQTTTPAPTTTPSPTTTVPGGTPQTGYGGMN